MHLRPLHDPSAGPLRLVALLSGSGSNLRRILEHQQALRRREGRFIYEVVALFSDNEKSKAREIGAEYGLPVVVRDLAAWLKEHGVLRSDLAGREAFDRATVEALRPYRAAAAAYAGYMSLATPPLIEAWLGVNVHPADLSIAAPGGGRRWTGAHAVRDAIAAGEKALRSSTHRVERECDMGRLFMVSAPVPVTVPAGTDLADPAQLEALAAAHQERLKERGDWVIFPRTLEALARGEFAEDAAGNLYFRGQAIPAGCRVPD